MKAPNNYYMGKGMGKGLVDLVQLNFLKVGQELAIALLSLSQGKVSFRVALLGTGRGMSYTTLFLQCDFSSEFSELRHCDVFRSSFEGNMPSVQLFILVVL